MARIFELRYRRDNYNLVSWKLSIDGTWAGCGDMYIDNFKVLKFMLIEGAKAYQDGEVKLIFETDDRQPVFMEGVNG